MKTKLVVLLLLIGLSGQAQNLIGYKTNDIIEYYESQQDKKSSEKEPHYGKTKDGIPYVYFTKSIGHSTYYLDSDGVCIVYSTIYTDYSNLNYVVELMNKNFVPMGDNKWMHYDKRGTYDLELIREEEFFAIVWTIHKP